MMKLFIIFFVLISGLIAYPIGEDQAYKEALALMGKSDKLVLMIYTANDCPECAYMKKKVFTDPQVNEYLSTNFIIIEKNVHRDKLPDGYDYFGIPTIFFIDKNGVKIETLVGSNRTMEFTKELKRIRGLK